MPELPTLLTTAEVVAALRVSRQTVGVWVKEGKLRPVQMPGRDKRFRLSDIEALLQPQDAPTERAS